MSEVRCSNCGVQEPKKDHNMKKAFFNNVWVCSEGCHVEYEISCRSYPDKCTRLNNKTKEEIFNYWDN